MNAIALMVATAALGVDYGWHRGPDGEWEYIIQIEPALVDTLSRGQALVSQMPPELRGVRRFRIQIGQGEIPREQLPAGGLLNVSLGANSPGADGLRPLTPNGFDPRGNLASGATTANGMGLGGRSPPGGSLAGGGLAGGSLSGWQGPEVPAEPGSYSFRDFGWIRYEPIRVDPLENSFVSDARWNGFNADRASTRFPGASGPGASGRDPQSSWPRGGEPGGSLPGLPSPPGTLPGFRSPMGPEAGNVSPSGSGFGPMPGPFDAQRGAATWQGPDGAGGRLSIPGASGNWTSPNGGVNWPADGRPTEFQAPGTQGGNRGPGFDLPERPRLDVENPNDLEAARRLRLNDERLGAGRGFTASLPSPGARPPSGAGAPRDPSVSLSTPERGRLPDDGADRADDSRRTSSSGRAVSGGDRRTAHAEITSAGANRTTAANAASEKMWWPLTTTVLLLFGSLGGNVYLGWLAMDFYRRYRECAWELRTGN